MYRFEIYRDARGEWRWRFLSVGNSEIIAVSSESYVSKAGCMNSINLVKAYASGAPIREVVR